jgi:hypothetical protein
MQTTNNKEIRRADFSKAKANKSIYIEKRNKADRKVKANRRKPKKRCNSKPTAKIITNKEMHALNGNIVVDVIPVVGGMAVLFPRTGIREAESLKMHAELSGCLVTLQMPTALIPKIVLIIIFGVDGLDINHIMHSLNGNTTTVIKYNDGHFQVRTPPPLTLTVNRVPDAPAPPVPLDMDRMNWCRYHKMPRVRTDDAMFYRYTDEGRHALGSVPAEHWLPVDAAAALPAACTEPEYVAALEEVVRRSEGAQVPAAPPAQQKPDAVILEIRKTKRSLRKPSKVPVPKRALDGEHPATGLLDENFYKLTGELIRTTSLKYSTVKYRGDFRLSSLTMTPVLEEDYVLGSWITDMNPIGWLGKASLKVAEWLGFGRSGDAENKAWKLIAKFMGPNDHREILFAPHLVSCAIADSRNETSIDVLKANTRARLMRISSFPLEDTIAIRVLAGSELVGILVAMTVLNLRGAVSSGRYTAHWSETDSENYQLGSLAPMPRFTRLVTEAPRPHCLYRLVNWYRHRRLILLGILAILIALGTFAALILATSRGMPPSPLIATTETHLSVASRNESSVILPTYQQEVEKTVIVHGLSNQRPVPNKGPHAAAYNIMTFMAWIGTIVIVNSFGLFNLGWTIILFLFLFRRLRIGSLRRPIHSLVEMISRLFTRDYVAVRHVET